MQAKSIKPATDREIRTILGPADDETVNAIRNTGASQEEVLQAVEWMDDDDYMGKTANKTLTGNVRRVYEILQEDSEKTDGDRL
jgi:hypothetical protein